MLHALLQKANRLYRIKVAILEGGLIQCIELQGKESFLGINYWMFDLHEIISKRQCL